VAGTTPRYQRTVDLLTKFVEDHKLDRKAVRDLWELVDTALWSGYNDAREEAGLSFHETPARPEKD
jgi:hypothetical protein